MEYIDALKLAVAECIDCFDHRRLHGEIGAVPPAEYADTYYRSNPVPTSVAESLQGLDRTWRGRGATNDLVHG